MTTSALRRTSALAWLLAASACSAAADNPSTSEPTQASNAQESADGAAAAESSASTGASLRNSGGVRAHSKGPAASPFAQTCPSGTHSACTIDPETHTRDCQCVDDDPCVNNLAYHQGPVLANPRLVQIFLGQLWDDGQSAQPLRSAVLADGRSMANALDYYDPVREYGVGDGSWLAFRVESAFAPEPGQLTEQNLQDQISFEIQQAQVPAPDDNTFYMVYLSTDYSDATDFDGNGNLRWLAHHSDFYDSPSGHTIPYGVAEAADENTEIQNTAHEFWEAQTNPFFSGYFNGPTSDAIEVSDLCQGSNYVIPSNGMSLFASAWSNGRCACQ